MMGLGWIEGWEGWWGRGRRDVDVDVDVVVVIFFGGFEGLKGG